MKVIFISVDYEKINGGLSRTNFFYINYIHASLVFFSNAHHSKFIPNLVG